MALNISTNNLTTFLQDKGIFHQATYWNTPQHNGIAKRKNRHLLEVVNVLMFQNIYGVMQSL